MSGSTEKLYWKNSEKRSINSFAVLDDYDDKDFFFNNEKQRQLHQA